MDNILRKISNFNIIPDKIWNKIRNARLKDKLNFIVLISTIPLILLTFIIMGVYYAEIEKNLENQNFTYVMNVKNAYEYFESQSYVISRMVALNYSIKKAIVVNDSSKILQIIHPITKDTGIDVLSIYDKDFYALARGHDPGRFGDKVLDPVFAEVIKYQSPITAIVKRGDRYRLVTVYPITFEGDFLGIAEAGYIIDYNFLNRLKSLAGVDIFFFSKNKLIATSMGRLKKIYDFSYDLSNDFIIRREVIFHTLSGRNIVSTYDFIIRPINTFSIEKHFALAIGVDNTSIRNVQTVMFLVSFFVALLLIGIVMIVAFKIARGIALSTETVIKTMREIAKGNLNRQIQVTSKDEIGEIAENFNRMVIELRSSYENLKELNRIANKLNSILDKSELFYDSLKDAVKLLGADIGLYITFTQNSLDGFLEASYNISIKDDKKRIPELRKVFQNYRSPLIIKDRGVIVSFFEALKKAEVDVSTLEEYDSFLVIPLYDGENLECVIVLFKKDGFRENHIELAKSIANQILISLENIKRFWIESDVKAAKIIQESLIPHKMPKINCMDVYGITVPAKGIGGDYFDFIVQEDEEISQEAFIIVGDVSGKGISAGLVMVMARAFVHSISKIYKSTKDIIVRLNDFLYKNLEEGRFMSGILFRWDAIQRKMFYTGAGHEYMLVYDSSNDSVHPIAPGGTLLGIIGDHNKVFELFDEQEIPFKKDDVILLITDGVTEARNENKEEYGIERLTKVFKSSVHLSPKEIVEKILEDIKKFTGAAEQHDDITMVVMKCVECVPIKIASEYKEIMPVLKEINVLINENKLDDAILKIREYLNRYPNESHLYSKLGVCYRKKGMVEEAIEYFQKAIDIDPKNVEALSNLGFIYRDLKDYEKAVILWKRVLSINPRLEVVRKNLSRIEDLLNKG